MKNYGIILASGNGTRFGSDKPKQFIKIAGKTILEHTISIFERSSCIDEIILVVLPEYKYFVEEIVAQNNYKKIKKILNGGTTRKESSCIGINSVDDDNSHVIIHDCVRPFLSERIIEDCIRALEKYDAVDVAIKASDTIIEVNPDSTIKSIPNRDFMMRGQTPQCFKTGLIKKAHEIAGLNKDQDFSDDCGLIVKYKLADVFVVYGEEKNIKITYPEDIFLADKLFQVNSIGTPGSIDLLKLKNKNIVVFGASRGIGYQVKKIAERYQANVFGFSRKNGIDISRLEDVQRAIENVFQKTKKIDFVVSTAGVLNIGKLEDRSYSDIISEININYVGAINVSKASIPYLKKSHGSLLFFASSSYTRGRALYSVYSSTKAAIVNLTQALAEELFNERVKINVINPERTATPMRFKNFGHEPKDSLLDPKDVAKKSLQVLLSSLTGQVIDIKKSAQL